MRLIDGDALIKYCNGNPFITDSVKTYIRISVATMPTIEERKTGKWVRITQGATPEKYMCPFCHSTVEHEGAEYLVSMMYPFCHCGARMVQEGENNA